MQRYTFFILLATIVTVLVGVGLAWAGGTQGVKIGGISVFALCAVTAFAVNWLAFIPAAIMQTEKFYDLVGSLTYLSVVALAVLLSSDLDLRATLVSLMVMIWAVRLGSFLFMRIHQDGTDDRFDEIKRSVPRFLFAWTMQGLWVIFTAAAALAIITSNERIPLGWLGILGALVWSSGFIIEVIADAQKRAFKRDSTNRGEFIRHGLWAWSRHPNYFGEITLWVGIALMAIPVISGWQWVVMISPIFVYLLITKISGIPTLQKKAEAKWGDDAAYQDYVRRTSRLVPMPPKTG
jgi:steroid 5-alpha reductase family enzyme